MDELDPHAITWVPRFDEGDVKNALMRDRVAAGLFGESKLARIGRFEIERALGTGGMGEVYLAHDPELRRQVAIKLLHAHLFEADDSIGRARARREGQALAQVSHPNVVEVFEVGEHHGRPFIAMEYIEGTTLGVWLLQTDPRWREIVEVFIAAGRGLMAAHRVGLVHRDFKLDNVLISGAGSERRVRVLDFGLARVAGLDDSAMLESTDDSRPDGNEPGLTRPGAVMGTLLYMSPEQLRGHTADAASDQFSFCVAMYRALWQRTPFEGASVTERLSSIETTELEPPPSGAVPRGIWPIIRRGLARDPDQRWPSMDELLAALERVLRRRRMWPLLAMIGIAAGVGVGVGVMSVGAAPAVIDQCRAVEMRAEELWTAAQAARAQASFQARPSSFAASSFATVDATLGRWSQAWLDARMQLCRRGEHDSQRAVCLDRAHARAKLLVEALDEADARTIEHAVESLAALPSLSVCETNEDVMLGLAAVPAGIADALEAQRQTLARVRVLRMTGHVEAAAELMATLERDAAGLDYPPFAAELAVEQADLAFAQLVAGDTTKQRAAMVHAAELAESSRHDRVAAMAWTELARWAANAGGAADDEVQSSLARAQINVTRIGAPPDLQARLHCARGALLARDPEQRADARASLERGVELLSSLGADDISKLWRPLCMMDLAAVESGAAGVARGERALAEAEDLFGPGHPQVSALQFELARVLLDSGLPDAGPRSAALLEQLGSSTLARSDAAGREVAQAHVGLAAVALESGELDSARRHSAIVRALQAQLLPADDYQHAEPLMIEALIDYREGAFDSALGRYDRARELLAAAPGFEAQLVALDVSRAYCLLELGRLDDAEQLFLARRGPARDNPSIELGLARIELRRGSLARARALLDVHGADRLALDAIMQLRAGRALDCKALAAELAAREASLDISIDLTVSQGERRCLGWDRSSLAPPKP